MPLPFVSARGNRGGMFAAGPAAPVSSAAQVTQQDNLLHWWKMDEGSGSTAADSGSGAISDTNLTLTNDADWSAGPNSWGAVALDGTDDHLDSSTFDLNITTAFSASLWIKSDAASTTAYTNGYRAWMHYGYDASEYAFVLYSHNTLQYGYMSLSAGAQWEAGAVDTSADTITITGHPFSTGDAMSIRSSGTTPGGISAFSTHYMIDVDANTIKVAASSADASAGTARNITGTGSGLMAFYAYDTELAAYGSVISDVTDWNHWAFTWAAGSPMKQYANGILVDTAPSSLSSGHSMVWTKGSKIQIGDRIDSTTTMNAQFSDARIYNMELSSDDVDAIYNSGDGDRG